MAISDNLETVKNSGPVLKAAYMIQVSAHGFVHRTRSMGQITV